LKKAVRGIIPDEIIDRRKQGFGVPVVEWFQQELGAKIRKKLIDFAGAQPYLDRTAVAKLLENQGSALPWYLFNFVLWHEAWIEQEVVA
jgi:asparagine synthase (glutamine-hydrolysing)